ncbi:ABC transporter ATP-binding protein [Enterobacter sp. Ap-1006]|uniref:ABC transporter ATP-binding protein n=1 Tax=Enterobacter sp. Ap-1006 TaxID=2608345 RepID=UPI00142476EC|nr:ABC transporter ATP-binding protein [Enterobacter sp. Ap-1006]NIF46269.1 ABC transporter ATP-binding protein [Enterobacter sp. Ap-1006]
MIQLENINKIYPGNVQHAINSLNMTIHEGEFCTFVGPSGCGKTTTLRMINRLDIPDSGEVYIQGEPLSRADIIQIRRKIGFVMQSPALFPHRTVAENIATVPRLLGWDKRAISRRIDELVALMSLNPLVLKRYPHQLSGGQQSRVSIARALAADPPILLMDEPFAAIDPVVRDRLQGELLALQARLHKTIILVTHDINEAIRLGDRIAIFREGGHLEQFDTPDNILSWPASDFVRDFIGPEPNLKRLGMMRVGDLPRRDVPVFTHDEPASADPALLHGQRALVLDAEGRPQHWQENGQQLPVRIAKESESLRHVYSALLDVPQGVLVRVTAEGHYAGAVDSALLSDALNRHQELHRND